MLPIHVLRRLHLYNPIIFERKATYHTRARGMTQLGSAFSDGEF
jgi:hypothetical protein